MVTDHDSVSGGIQVGDKVRQGVLSLRHPIHRHAGEEITGIYRAMPCGYVGEAERMEPAQDDRNAAGAQLPDNGVEIAAHPRLRHPEADVVTAEENDGNVGTLRYGRIEPPQSSARGVTVDTAVPDNNVVSARSQGLLKLRRIFVRRRNREAGGIAVAKRDNADCRRRRGLEQQDERKHYIAQVWAQQSMQMHGFFPDQIFLPD
jgi:hypothetical protein